MLDKILDRLTPDARKYVDAVLSEANEFEVSFTRASKNRHRGYESEDTGLTLHVSHKFPLARLSDASFVLGWVQDVMLLVRLYGGAQISATQYKLDRDQLLSRMEKTSAILEGREKPDLSHLQSEQSVDLDSSPTSSQRSDSDSIEGTVDLDAVPYAGGTEGAAKNGAFEFGPYEKLAQAMDEIVPEEGLYIWKLVEDAPEKAAEPSEDASEWVIL